MKITADTNTLISATFWSGSSDKIISKAEIKAIELVLSDDILKEYSEVLNYEEIQNHKNPPRAADPTLKSGV